MEIADLKLAAYLEEAGDDLSVACDTLKKHNINYAVLRNVWVGNICDVDDTTCANIRTTLLRHSISVVAVATDLGKVPVSQLKKIPIAKIDRAFNIAKFYGASQMRIGIGVKSKEVVALDLVHQWMQYVTDRCLDANLVPLFEITEDSSLYTPAEIAACMTKFKRWKLLYDPVQLILRQKQEPFVKYWTLLKTFVASMDVRDYKIGVGFKPAGFGDAQTRLAMNDAIKTGFTGWFFLEPTLGRKHGNAVTKHDTFNMAMEALQVLLS